MAHLSTSIKTGSLLFLSGQLAFDTDGNISGGIEQQTAFILAKHFKELAKHNLRPENVVKAGVWLTERNNFQSFDSAYALAFGDHRPARSTVISQLAVQGALVEIDLVASFDSIVW
ncbi:RidA family protein [Alteromonas sp. NFXS44]|uniref:RidA family protein n=1 Tax=Alteromonas sp. NFXS44 TaxID=2818435 RepID=UPI0032DF3D64